MILSKPTFTTFLATLLAALLLTGASAVASGDSLYRSDDSRNAPSSLFGFFGPKSSGIKYDSRMIRAAEIAEARARGHSVKRCWRYVKNALLAAEAVNSYPGTAYAKQAGSELTTNYGFKPIRVSNPYDAPVGSVLVYGGKGAGHVEIRTDDGFVSDFKSAKPSKRPLIGVYVKPS